MNVHEGIDGLKQVPAGAVMSIGNFDGLHRGHEKIPATMRSLGERIAVVTFEPHPFTVLRPQFAPPRLAPPAMKRRLLESAGVHDLVILPPTREVLGLTAQQFWSILRDEVKPSNLVEGASFTFGKDRGGNVERLKEWSAHSDVKIHLIEAVQVPLLDLHIVEVNSTIIRWLISYGRVRDAAICLGRAYTLQGKIIRGYGRGRGIGMPTANLDCGDQFIPDDGVYAGRCTIDAKRYPAAISIGTMPTFGENRRQVEAHLIGFNGNLYERVIDVEVVDWLREQVRFGSVEALKSQLAIDLAHVEQRFLLRPELVQVACVL
jgi:riboflavin kinase/FMN adenylyltransferase